MQDESLTKQQLEALEELYHYSQRLIPAIETVSKELRESKQDDTEEYLKLVINGINWIIEVLNHTMELVNAEETIIEKEKINSGILKLGDAIKNKNNNEIGESLTQEILPFLTVLSTRAAILTNQVFN